MSDFNPPPVSSSRKFTEVLGDGFDANKDLKDPVQIQKVLAEGEAELWEFRHPDPYVLNHMPGGTKYQRYPRNGLGLPPEVCALPSYLK